MTKARNLADNALTTVSPTELGYVDGVTSPIQTQLDAKIAKTLTTTTGDIIYASSANTPARLGIGSTGQALTVSGGVPAWSTPVSGSLTLISTTTLTGASVTLSSIPQTYKSLYLVVYGVTNATADGVFAINPNTAITSSQVAIRSFDANVVSTNGDFRVTADKDLDRTNANNIFTLTFNNYVSTTAYKSFSWSGFYGSAAVTYCAINGGGGFRSNTAITSLNIKNYGGNLSTGTVELYGVN